VYNGVVERTQVYLEKEELALLDRQSKATGASRSELIRRAVRMVFGGTTKDDRLRALEASAGAFGNLGISGAQYVDTIRGDMNDRLERLQAR
jgi:Arc/MetJ-type ribon-helix-helix transcriptional regulator